MFKLLSVLAVAGLAAAQTFMVNTPSNVVECEPTLITWTGGNPPFILSVQDGNNPSGPSLINLGTQTGNQFTWNTSIAGGTSISLAVRDSTGATVQSAAFTVNAGSSSCLSGSSSSTGSSGTSTTGSSSSSSSASTTTSISTTSVSSTTLGSTTSISSSSTDSSSKTSSSSKESSTSPSGTSTTSGSTSSTTTSGAVQVKVASFGIGALVAAGVLAVIA